MIERAKANQVPADVIKRAIEKAKGGTGENYSEASYEGFGAGGQATVFSGFHLCFQSHLFTYIPYFILDEIEPDDPFFILLSIFLRYERKSLYTLFPFPVSPCMIFYPEYVPVTWYGDYDIEGRKPDMIFIHNPYDEFNYVTSVHPMFYAKELKKYTDMLV